MILLHFMLPQETDVMETVASTGHVHAAPNTRRMLYTLIDTHAYSAVMANSSAVRLCETTLSVLSLLPRPAHVIHKLPPFPLWLLKCIRRILF